MTNVTRLDRLGMPVFASVRPRGRTLRVHAGKGFDLAQARLGALVEAIELALAERDGLRAADGFASLHDMQRTWPDAVTIHHLAPEHGVRIDATRPVPVVRCELLRHGRRPSSVLVPARLVRCTVHATDDENWFSWSSNGLAAGSTLDEATLHATLELLERDTLALHSARDESLLLRELPPLVDAWRQRWAEQGVELIVRAMPNEFGLACFSAWLHEPASASVDIANGSAMSPQREVALARAVAEAAQSRLSLLHGGRDDITHFFSKFEPSDARKRLREQDDLLARLKDAARTSRWEDLPDERPRTPEAALRRLRGRLAARGFKWLIRHRLPWPAVGRREPPLQVVKVVIPGCEMLEPHNRRIGPRLLLRLTGHD